jgi:hypothetical protein
LMDRCETGQKPVKSPKSNNQEQNRNEKK